MRKLSAIVCVLLLAAACGGSKNVARTEGRTETRPQTIDIRVRKALLSARNVHASEIQVEVSGQVVTLKGEVHGQPEIDAAIAAARSVPGVQEVKSELRSKS